MAARPGCQPRRLTKPEATRPRGRRQHRCARAQDLWPAPMPSAPSGWSPGPGRRPGAEARAAAIARAARRPTGCTPLPHPHRGAGGTAPSGSTGGRGRRAAASRDQLLLAAPDPRRLAWVACRRCAGQRAGAAAVKPARRCGVLPAGYQPEGKGADGDGADGGRHDPLLGRAAGGSVGRASAAASHGIVPCVATSFSGRQCVDRAANHACCATARARCTFVQASSLKATRCGAGEDEWAYRRR